MSDESVQAMACPRRLPSTLTWLPTSLTRPGSGKPAGLERRRQLLARIAAGCVAGLAAAALVQPALWTLAYALTGWRRQALVAGWVLTLGLGLPAMALLGSSHSVPQILGRCLGSLLG